MKPSIITIGNGGYNIAADAIESGIFSDFKLIVCDSDADDLKRNSVSADRSFLLDDSVDKFSLTDNPMIKPIVDGVTDRIYIFAALGGMVTRINVPPLLVEMDAPRRFIWSIITMPSDLEGAEISHLPVASGMHRYVSRTGQQQTFYYFGTAYRRYEQADS